METTTQKTFLRKNSTKLDFVPLTIKDGETKFVEILSDKIATVFVKSKGEDIPCVVVKDLQNDEQRIIWLSGKLMAAVKLMQATGPIKNKKLEITRAGTESIEVEGDTWDMNNFEVYELQ